MREGTAPIIRREDYTQPAYWIRAVELTFDLDPAKTIVSSRMQVERNTARDGGALRLDGEGLNLLRVLIDGESVSFRHDDGALVIDSPPDKPAFTLEIRNTCCPEKNTELSGLYTSGGGFFTQCEAQGFRRITYFLDRPDVMAVYTVTLRADKARWPVLLSNGNLVEEGPLDNGRHFAKWHDPHPKPSYLFALVAGRLVAREQRIKARNGREHLLQVYVRPGDLGKTEHAMRSLVASVVWDEARFGLPLDLDRFMVVAVEDFNMGAMENKGLNLFNTKYVLASPATATDADFDAIEAIVGHEYFHNWTGNRITCRDWFQLSLKEGLTVFRDQEFSMDMAGSVSARAIKRIEDVRTLRLVQFPEDAGPMAHPVRPDAYAAIDNFYTPTVYEKGAEVVRMAHTLVGREGFARGITEYFRRHDGQAVTCDDFVAAVADANPGSPLATHRGAFLRWYATAGTPALVARGEHDAAARRYTLTLTQQGRGAPQVIPVAMGLLGADNRPLPLRLEGEPEAQGTERTLVLSEATQRFVFEDVNEPPLPSLLRGFSAPVALDDGLDSAARLRLLAHDTDAFNRWEAAQRLLRDSLVAAAWRGADSGTPVLDALLVAALRGVLRDDTLDAGFRHLVLALPPERELIEHCRGADPALVSAARERALDELAHALRADWLAVHEACRVREGYAPTPQQAGRRALANQALAMLVRDDHRQGEPVWPGRAYQAFKSASNMTDRLAALEALLAVHHDLAQGALERMAAEFAHDPLVMDKWYAVQMRAPERDGRVFARLKQLLQRRDFSLANPNRVRALLFTWDTNPAAFHRRDAAGYVLWADQVLAIDALNPQLAARFARALDRWAALPEPYRGAAREAIARVAARPELSTDTREIVTRALESA